MGGINSQNNCFINDFSRGARNSYAIVNAFAYALVKSFQVLDIPGIKVHKVLRFGFFASALPPGINTNLAPSSLFDSLWEHFVWAGGATHFFDEDLLIPGEGKPWKAYLVQLSISQEFERQQLAMQSLLEQGDTQTCFERWSSIIDTSISWHSGLDDKKRFGGGKQILVRKIAKDSIAIVKCEDGQEAEIVLTIRFCARARFLRKQVPGLQQWVARLKLT